MGLFDLEIMRSSYFSEEEFTKGKLLYNKFSVSVINVKQDMMSDNYTIFCEVKDEGVEVKTEIEIGKSRASNRFILASERNCTCKKYVKDHENCSHMAALVHYVNEFEENQLLKLHEISSGDTSEELILLKNDFLSQYYNDLHTSAQPMIYPFLSIIEDQFYLTLKIGSGNTKPYLIKDLKVFTDYFEDKDVVEYGKNLTVMHDVGLFYKNCQPLLLYILDLIAVKSSLVEERKMTLTEQQLSSIVRHCENTVISFESKITLEKEYLVEDIESPIYILATKNEDSVVLNLCSNVEFVHILNRHILCTKDDKFMLVSYDDFNNFKLLKLLRSRNLMIKLEDFFNIYDIILCNLDSSLKIAYDFDISSLLAMTTNFSIKIYEEKSNIIVFPYLEIESEKYDVITLMNCDISYSHSELLKINKILREFAVLIDEKYIISEPEKMYQFLKIGIDKLAGLIDDLRVDESIKNIKILNNTKVNTTLHKVGGHLSVDVILEGVNPKELEKILKARNLKKDFYRLENGNFLELDSEFLKKIEEVAQELEIEIVDGKIEIPIFKSSLVETLFQDNNFSLQKDKSFMSYLKAFDHNNIDENPEVSNAELKKYQIDGFKFLKTMENLNLGAILADDMGLGKTIQVISILNNYQNLVSALVVCPSSLILNWQRELVKFAPNLSTRVVVGSQHERYNILKVDSKKQIYITSFDLLKRDAEYYCQVEYDYLIVDEAHFMKNNSSLNFKTITSLKAKHKIAMTGTPIENNLSELWSLMHFIMPNLLGNYSKFVKYYETPITKFEDEDRLDKLKNIVQPFILRRMKTDVLTELPSKLEEFKYANLDGEHYLAYQEALVDIRNTIKNNGQQIENKIIILSMLTRLRQLACDARLLTPTIKKISPKLELALEIIEKSIENERKILLFSQFTSMLDLIEIELNKKGIKFYTLKGSTPKEKRDQMSENFNKDETMVFLISLKAGGTGLNLTGASTVIHFDPWWNMSAQNQATDRVHRIGQKDNVLVYKLISESTIEEKIVKLQEEKSVLAKNMLDDNSNNIGKLSKDELLDLFNV